MQSSMAIQSKIDADVVSNENVSFGTVHGTTNNIVFRGLMTGLLTIFFVCIIILFK